MKWFDRLPMIGKLLLSLARMNGLIEEIGELHMDGFLYWVEEANKNKLNMDLDAANLTLADDAGKTRLKAKMAASLVSMHRAFEQLRPAIIFAEGLALYDNAAKAVGAWEDIVQMQTSTKPMPIDVDQMGLVSCAIAASETAHVALERLADFKTPARHHSPDARAGRIGDDANRHVRLRVRRDGRGRAAGVVHWPPSVEAARRRVDRRVRADRGDGGAYLGRQQGRFLGQPQSDRRGGDARARHGRFHAEARWFHARWHRNGYVRRDHSVRRVAPA